MATHRAILEAAPEIEINLLIGTFLVNILEASVIMQNAFRGFIDAM